MQTLRRERRQKFEEEIQSSQIHYYARLHLEHAGNTPEYVENTLLECRAKLSELLAEAAESRSERKTDEKAADYNAELFRGDPNEYPEHIREIAKVLRDTWLFVLPPKTKGKRGKQYGFFISSMESLKLSCGEFGTDVLVKLHTDWRAGFKNGIAPYTIANPQSLVNVAAGKAREMREAKSGATPQSGHRSARLERDL